MLSNDDVKFCRTVRAVNAPSAGAAAYSVTTHTHTHIRRDSYIRAPMH